MTAYQRGNRDGLLSAAAALEASAEASHKEADKYATVSTFGGRRLADLDRARAGAYQFAAGRLRELARALPLDPEDE